MELLRRNKLLAGMAHSIAKVGVVGAGQMGSGIAHVVALAGFDVLLHDVSPDRIKSSLATINGNMARQISSAKITEADRRAALGRISPAESVESLADSMTISASSRRPRTKLSSVRSS